MAEYGLKNSLAAAIKRAWRMEKVITLLLLFVLLTAATAGVSTVLTGADWAALWESLLLGVLAGWVLGIFRWPAWRSAVLLLVLGLLFGLLSAGGLSEKILAVLGELFRLLGQVISTLSIKAFDPATLVRMTGQVFSSTGVVVERVYTWVKDLAAGQPAFDPVATAVVWSIVVWLVAAWAGWVVEAGKSALAAVLPALLLNLSTLSYGRYNSASIYLLLGVTLVLIAVVQYDQREQEWTQTGVAYPARKSREVGNISLGLAILLVVLGAVISSLSFQQIIHWASEIRGTSPRLESGLAKSLGILPAATATADAFSNLRNPGLPRELLIGSGPELSTEQVMSVEVKDLTSLVKGGQLPPLYWRSYTYDIYTGHGWSSSSTEQNQYQPDQPIQPDHLPGHAAIQEVVRFVPGKGGAVYTAGEPFMVNVPSSAAWRSSNDLFGIQVGSNGYEAGSLLPLVDENALRKAGNAYPNWVVQRYLAVPTEIPTRVKQLALQLTATEPTPYDRARAIERYLRENYPYSLDVPLPPANKDLVDYFLFELRQGYCDYYASAMVILSRAAGIPARLAIGYATGIYNLNSKRFIVTQADAHSWAEVYFPSIGWVPFEPTAGLPPIDRSGQPVQAATPPPATPPVPSSGAGTGNLGKYSGYLLLGILLIAVLFWAIFDELKMRRSKPLSAAREVYRRLRRYGTLLSVAHERGETPYEFAAALSQRITKISGQTFSASTGVKSVEEAQAVIREIVQLSYRPARTDAAAGQKMVKQWRILRWHLRLMWILNSWQNIVSQFREKSAGLGMSPSDPYGQES